MTATPPRPGQLSSKNNAALLAAYGLLIFLRYPWLLTHGRLWAEEGPVYLRGAWSGPIVSSLFASHLGYLSIWPDFSALLAARAFPLPAAALVMSWCAFLMQLLAGYLVVQCELLRTLISRAIALAILLVGVGMESWLNTINSQFYLVICAGVILMSRPDRLRIFRGAVLLLASLTGPMTASLAPFFLVRALLTKTRASLLQAAIVVSCACVQMFVVFEALHAGMRRTNFQLSGVAPIFLVNFLVAPISGRLGRALGYAIVLNSTNRILPAGGLPHFSLSLPFLLTWAIVDLAAIAALFFLTADRDDRMPWWLLAIALWLAAFAMYGAVGGTYHLDERYVFPSAFLIASSLLLTSTKVALPKARRVTANILLAMFLLAGTGDYFYYARWAAKQRSGEPTWTQQAKLWQSDPKTMLPVWPKDWLPQGFSLPARQK